MKKLFALVVLSLCVTAPLFGANVVGHSLEVAGGWDGLGERSEQGR